MESIGHREEHTVMIKLVTNLQLMMHHQGLGLTHMDHSKEGILINHVKRHMGNQDLGLMAMDKSRGGIHLQIIEAPQDIDPVHMGLNKEEEMNQNKKLRKDNRD